MREIYKKATQVDTEGTTTAYQMATKELDTSEWLEQTPPTTMTEPDPEYKLSPGRKKLGPNNPDQVEQFMTKTNKVVECFLQNLLNSEPCTIKEVYQVLIREYHQYLCSIEDYFHDADRTVVFDIIDDTSCKLLKMENAKEADREKCPDPRTSTDNLMTGNHALSHLVALPNFESIKGDDRVAVCELFDSLQTAHNAAADVVGYLTTLGRMLDPQQFQFILKHSLHPFIQLQVPVGLCHPGELQFAKRNLSSDEHFEQ